MEIIPAVDIREGKCVRLYQGDYGKETVFSNDPIEAALKWQSMGAPRLHIVDLDGAATGELCNLEIIREISRTLLVPTQMGGGIRSLESVEQVLKAGVERVVLSTAAVEDSQLVKVACRKFGEGIIVSIDARDGCVAVRGWSQETELKTLDFARSMARLGVRRFIYTDISRDGTLTEPNFAGIAEMLDVVKQPLIAAGGIASIAHLKLLRRLGLEGAIVGKALYTGDILLKQALAIIDQ